MLDSKRDRQSNTKTNPYLNPNREIIDLTKAHYELDHDYSCVDCGISLILFPQGESLYPLNKGPHYICPQCHQITDSAFGNMLHTDDIKPIDIQPPTFAFVPEEKSSTPDSLGYTRYGDIDPEPQEEERLRNMGATIKDVRIISRRDY